MRVIRLSVLLFAVSGILATAPGRAAPANAPAGLSTPQLIERAVARGEIDRMSADLLLVDAIRGERVPAAYESGVPFRGTLLLLQLRDRLESMARGPDRRALKTALHPGPGGTGTDFCDFSASPTPFTTESAHFYIEYGSIGGGLDVNDYIVSLETTWATEVDAFGWAAPPVLPANPPPNGKYHVRIVPLGPALYGFVSDTGTHAGAAGNNPSTPWNDQDASASCMALNNDFSTFPGTPQTAMDATVAHEFNHSIQFGYGGLSGANTPDDVFIEGGATWMEDEVFDASNDNYNYLWPEFADDMGEYIDLPTDSPYEYWITFRGLTEPHGTGVAGGGEEVMQRFWELTSKNEGDNLEAMDAALTPEGTTLEDAYHAYAIAVRFNRSCGGGYGAPHCLEEGPAYVAAAGPVPTHGTVPFGGSFVGSIPDNYSLHWVDLPTTGAPYQTILRNISPQAGRFRGSVACDTGVGLRVVPFSRIAEGGQSAYVRIFDPAGCMRVTAVVTNVSQTAANPTSSTLRSYEIAVTSPPSSSQTKVRARSKNDEIRVRGRVQPAQPGDDMVVSLFRQKNGRWRRLHRQHVALKNGMKFAARFGAPNAERCRIEASFLGDDDHLPSAAARNLRCRPG